MIGAHTMLARFTVGAWVLVALFFFFVPAAVAQTSPHTPSGLVPCGGVTAGNALGATECGLCDLVTLSQNIINFLLMLTVPLSVGLFAWAGVLYFTSGGNPTNITRAHGIFRSVIIGFVIALSAWLVVQTILHSLVKKNFFLTGTWNSLTCAPDGERPRESSITDMFSFLRGGISGGGGSVSVVNNASNGGAAGSGALTTMQVTGPDGVTREVVFNASLADAALNSRYVTVRNDYGSQIDSACQGSTLPNCGAVVTALIGAESSGKPETSCNEFGACGLMQLTADKGGRSCTKGDNACTTDQINKGVQLLATIYNNPVSKQSLVNTLAGYNGGISTVPGTSVSGKNPALATSVDCPGMYAWQCAVNAGGLTATQKYVATICRTVKNNGASC